MAVAAADAMAVDPYRSLTTTSLSIIDRCCTRCSLTVSTPACSWTFS